MPSRIIPKAIGPAIFTALPITTGGVKINGMGTSGCGKKVAPSIQATATTVTPNTARGYMVVDTIPLSRDIIIPGSSSLLIPGARAHSISEYD